MRLLALLLLSCVTCLAAAKNPEAGEPAPAIEATTLDGATFSLAAESGKVVIVHFWATWCAPCRAEMPLLEAFYQKHRAQGVQVLAINLDDPRDLAKVKAVMSPFSFPAALLSKTQAKGYGRLWRIPLTFVIDRQGILRRNAWKADPRVNASVLDAEVLPLLAAP